jgi:hypothetical protein
VSRRAPVPLWAVAIVLAWLGAIAAYELRLGPDAPTLCNLRRLTGIPCPTCGATRAGMAIIDGRVLDAIAFNPLVVIGGAIAAVLIALRVALGRAVRVDLPVWGRRVTWALLAVAFVTNWIYVIRRDWPA